MFRRFVFLFVLINVVLSAAAQNIETTDTGTYRTLDEVVVSSQSWRERIRNHRIGVERLELSTIAEMPSFAGEKDIVKSLSLLPGVNSESEGGGGFEVRGGTTSQNLVLLDGISLYNPAHVMGIFSTFNDDALGGVSLYKGTLPTVYGGATSSVLDVGLMPGDMTEWQGNFTVGILSARAGVSGPLVRDRLSMALYARRSYVDAFLQLVPKYRKTVMNFYDVTAKFRYLPGENDVLDLSFMIGHDNMAIKNVMGLYWGNLGASLKWNKSVGERWELSTVASFTHYDPKMESTMMLSDQMLKEFIRSYSVTETVTCRVSDNHTLDFGVKSELLRVKSAEFTFQGHKETDIRSGWENAVWLNYTGLFSDHWSLEGGCRLQLFTAPGGVRLNRFQSLVESSPVYMRKTYISPEPRLSVKYSINDNHNIKLGAGISSRNLHSVRTTTTSFPFDRYALTSTEIKPEYCRQVSAGYAGAASDGSFDWSAEVYFRSLKNVYDYRDGYGMYSGVNIENLISGGEGRGCGLEMMVRKNLGRLTGWVSYTLSSTRTRIDGINGGRWFDASSDRRHHISAVAILNLSPRWNLSGSWTFSSGQPLTAPDAKFELSGTTCYYFSTRNGYRTPPTHRLDLSASYTVKGKRNTYRWDFGIYNAYCRYNPYVIYFRDDPSSPSGTQAVQLSLFGIIPSVSYTLEF